MQYSHTYKILKGSWGIRVIAKAELVDSDQDISQDAQKIGTLNCVLVNHPLDENERAMFIKGIEFGVSDQPVDSLANKTLMINELIFDPCDFQVEGLFCVARGLIDEILGRDIYEFDATFSREENRYIYNLPVNE